MPVAVGELNGGSSRGEQWLTRVAIHVRSVVRKRMMLPIHNCEPVLGEQKRTNFDISIRNQNILQSVLGKFPITMNFT